MNTWTDTVAASLQNRWLGLWSFLPLLISALVVIVIGLVVASGLELAVRRILESARFDRFLERLGLKPHFERAGMELKGSWFVGRCVFWFMVLVFLLAASDSLGLFAFSAFLGQVLLFIPRVVAAVLIMLAAVMIGNVARRVTAASVFASRLHAGGFLGTLAWWAVVMFGFFASLDQLGVAGPIVQALVYGFIAMISLAGGLAFGLGGKGYAEHLLNKFRERTEERR
mgnify:CR=1 FL=1